jgi:hypothetical protein
MIALPTSHVLAPTILLYRNRATRTRLRHAQLRNRRHRIVEGLIVVLYVHYNHLPSRIELRCLPMVILNLINKYVPHMAHTSVELHGPMGITPKFPQLLRGHALMSLSVWRYFSSRTMPRSSRPVKSVIE